jgi:predicted PurR-regulated permease PerM
MGLPAGSTEGELAMSDGGAGAIFSVVDGLARHRLGRWVLLLGVLYWGFLGLVNPAHNGSLLGAAAAVVIILVISAAYRWKGRVRRTRGRSLVLLGGFALLAMVALVFSLFMLLRRKRNELPAEVPSFEEIEALAQDELQGAA